MLSNLFLTAWVTFSLAEDLEYQKVQLVDFSPVSQSFLFRGNEPIINGSFAFQALISFMENRSAALGLSFPATFYFVDISFLSWVLPSEDRDLRVEQEFFASHNSSFGLFQNWMLVGSATSPYDYPPAVREEIASHFENSKFDVDQLPVRIGLVRQLLTTVHDIPWVIYFHCEAGSDRTGEFAGSYYLQFKNMTLQEAFSEDDAIAGRPMEEFSQHGLEWYCFYLQYALGYKTVACEPPPTTNPL